MSLGDIATGFGASALLLERETSPADTRRRVGVPSAPGTDQRRQTASPLLASSEGGVSAYENGARDFDVFLCHNSADKAAVKRVGERLKQRGFAPWLDEWELPPGQPWQSALEQQMGRIRAAAVFFGGSGLSKWHEQEMRALLGEFVDRGAPVIPVLLPDASEKVPYLDS